MFRGRFLSSDYIDRLRIFEFESVHFDVIDNYTVQHFMETHFGDNLILDRETGNVIQAVEDPNIRITKFRMKITFSTTEFIYDKVFIDKDKLLFINSNRGTTRRINPSRIQKIEFLKGETFIFTHTQQL